MSGAAYRVKDAGIKGGWDRDAFALGERLQAYIKTSGPNTKRGLARELLVIALLLERADPGALDENLLRAVALYRRTQRSTANTLKKCASHARAMMRFATVDDRPLAEAVAAVEGDDDQVLAAVDEMVLAIPTKDALAHRAAQLAHASGGRPFKNAMGVLRAVVDLSERASFGDARAQTELRLISAFIQPEPARREGDEACPA